jgi:hypothetical protein
VAGIVVFVNSGLVALTVFSSVSAQKTCSSKLLQQTEGSGDRHRSPFASGLAAG